MSSRGLMDKFNPRPNFQTALACLSEGKYAPLPGGVLIKQGKRILGAVGVTGDSSDRDGIYSSYTVDYFSYMSCVM